MNYRQKLAHMRVAHEYGKLSYCKRLQVGCIIVKGDRVISIGYNGTPAKTDNCCEDEGGLTKSSVIHAEDNAIRKLKEAMQNLSESAETINGAILFVTIAPCIACAEIIIDFGIKDVIYDQPYRNELGISLLRDRGITVTQIDLNNNNNNQ